jgi:hypothetical protein
MISNIASLLMSTQITITLTDDVYQKADSPEERLRQRFARLANRDIASILADTIQNSIPNISEVATTLQPISLLSDADVLALTELQMEPAQDLQLSELLDRQQAGLLTDIESPEERLRQRSELQILMQTYQEGLLRKATALSEAVKRKLIKPLNE